MVRGMGKNNPISKLVLGNQGGDKLAEGLMARAKPASGPVAPDPAQARLDAIQGKKDELKRKRASSTLFTSGLGVDGNISASSLLGF